ncbi:MAG: transporter [Acidobacteriota bacterium]
MSLLLGSLVAGSPLAFSGKGREAALRQRGSGQAAWIFDVEPSHFEGDYDTGQEITFDVVTTRLRWQRGRGELRVSVPFVRLESRGEVMVIGGAPAGPGRLRAPSEPPPPARRRPNDDTESGLGDILLRGDVYLLEGGGRRPWLSAVGQVKLPTADEDKGLGTGETDVEGGLGLVQPLGKSTLFLDGRYTHLGDPPGIDLDNIVTTSVGLSHRLGRQAGAVAYAFLENRTDPIPGQDDRLDLFLGAGARPGRRGGMRVSGGVFIGLSDTAEDWGISLSLGRSFGKR